MANTVVGIDIGHETIKLASLEHIGKRFRLEGLHLANIPPSSWKADALSNLDEIAKTINESLHLAKPHSISGKKVAFALPESVIFSATLTMPALSTTDIEQALPFELAERLSIKPEEYYIDFEEVESRCRPIAQTTVASTKTDTTDLKKPVKEAEPIVAGENIIVFAAAAKRTLIDSIVELCHKAKLDLIGIDIKPGAIIRAVVPQSDQKARIIIDMGVGGTGASVAEGRSLRVTSTVPWGTHSLTQDISKPIPNLREILSPVFDELVHLTKFFENRVCPGLKIEEIIISGTGSGILGIKEVFQQETNLPTTLAAPFQRVDTHHFPVPTDLIHTFADSIGLAMRKTK